ncbi:protein kinase [Streptomyces sp. NPDC008150]|uniref:serine/threonine-protein kinase n=1 Tax=Streptomyces sp. NPDC008150 TaxID=3364816 RepID=UPI0036F04810
MQGRLLSDRYRLVEAIGSGGMGRVWRAHDEVLHRAVAIKELTAGFYATEAEQSKLLARTRAEARAAARINHSAVVTVHDVLEYDGRPWIVMELVDGSSLDDVVRERGRVDPVEAARVGLWVLRALMAAHAAGVLHRDVKPANVLLARDGRVLLTDFGIAQVDGDDHVTRTGELVGSVDYLAPERVRGQEPGPAADLWALGATLFTAVEGSPPFRGTSPFVTLQAIVEDEPARAPHAGPLTPVIGALLVKDPARRPDAARVQDLLTFASTSGPTVPDGRAAQSHLPRGVNLGRPGASGGAGGPGGPASGDTRHTGAQGGRPGDVTSATSAYTSPGDRPHGPAGRTGAAPGAPSALRRRGAIAAVTACVVLAGGATLALQHWNSDRGGTDATGAGSTVSASPDAGSGATPSASGSASPSASASTALPASWVTVDDPAGFSLALPKGWTRQETNGQIDYTPDGGRHFVRIALDSTPDYDDPNLHQLDLEQQLQGLQDYTRGSLEANTYRDCKGSLWDFTWTALAKDGPFPGPKHAVEETYIGRDGVEYALYVSGPAEDWAVTQERFQRVLQSWRQPDS